MKLGERRNTKEICVERVCEICEEPAQAKLTFLLIGTRNNPQSKAYGKDDCTWCSDESRFACTKHADEIRRNPTKGMTWCGEFTRSERFEHLFLYWQKMPDSLVKLQQDKLTDAIEKILEQVLMKHHDDISKQDDDAIVEARDAILDLITQEAK